MRLGVKPFAFLARVVCGLLPAYVAWLKLAPAYTHFLATLSQPVISLFDRPTLLWARGTSIFFWPQALSPPPQVPAVPAEWVEANLVLLIPLMLATPAPTWLAKARRVGLALAIAVAYQVLDVVVAIKFGYATQLDPMAYSPARRYAYAFLTDMVLFLDREVVPFIIWAGIHFRQLVGTLVSSPIAAKISGRGTPTTAKKAPRKLRNAKA